MHEPKKANPQHPPLSRSEAAPKKEGTTGLGPCSYLFLATPFFSHTTQRAAKGQGHLVVRRRRTLNGPQETRLCEQTRCRRLLTAWCS